MGVCSFIASFNGKMVTEAGESIFTEQHTEAIKTLPHLLTEAKKRVGQPLRSVNTENGNGSKIGYIPFQRSLNATTSDPTEMRAKWPILRQGSNLFTPNREAVNIYNAISDYRVRR